jgi:hypothetical protein
MQLGWAILTGMLGLGAIAEMGLRSIVGLGNPLLYIADPDIGYYLAPHQNVHRWRKRIRINEYSMRSEPLRDRAAAEGLRVLLLGDSVANGGWWTDQNETISALMQPEDSDATVEILNASANSWNPRNELAYLQRFGTFEADRIIVLINTDDLFGTQPSALPVGRDRNYPDHKPPLALIEAVQRYFLPPPEIPELTALSQEKGDRVGKNLDAIAQMQQIAQHHKADFLLALTPLKREVGDRSRDYEHKARQRLQQFVESRGLDFIDFLPLFQSQTDSEILFRDRIHLSPQGNALVSQHLREWAVNS